MKLIIEPTERFFMDGEVMVRLWQGTTECGAGVLALVAAVGAVDDNLDKLAKNLISIPSPTPAEARQWAEAVLARAQP